MHCMEKLIFLFIFLTSICGQLVEHIEKINCQMELFPEPPCCGDFKIKNTENEDIKKAALNYFPWTVFINGTKAITEKTKHTDIKMRYYCSGSLVNSRWVLTTAECIFKKNGNNWKWEVFIKSVMIATKSSLMFIQKYLVEKEFLHKSYEPTTKQNNIALLQLNDPVSINHIVKPVCLPLEAPTDAEVAEIGLVVAWGDNTRGDWHTNTLQKTIIHVLSIEKCKRFDWNYLPEMCAHIIHTNSDCNLMAGGPLMLRALNVDEQTAAFYIIGLAQLADGYCREPEAYTNITKHLHWIQNTIKRNKVKMD